MLRASLNRNNGDPDWDLRKLEPYSDYETYDFDVPTPPYDDAPSDAIIGDCWHRFSVRMREVVQSIRIVEQSLDRYETLHNEWLTLDPEHPEKSKKYREKYAHRVEPPRHVSPGECYVETECPRGQMGFHVVGRPNKDAVPLRVRARSSCFCNLSVIDQLCRDTLMADVPAIVGSLDIVMGEIDR